MEMERKAHVVDLEKQQKEMEKRSKRLPGVEEQLTRAEREARIWAFMYVTIP
jgi:uncharacterized protein involved in exopolysaccharide biosynthesis